MARSDSKDTAAATTRAQAPSGSQPSRCPACEATDERLRLPAGAYAYALCRRCGHGELLDAPTQAELDSLYEASYFEAAANAGYADYEADAALHRSNARARVSRLAAAGVLPPGRIVDFGCASGFFIEAAREAGYRACGVDVSSWARARAMSRGLEVHESIAITVTAQDDGFDAFCFFQSLEHLRDPLNALSRARSCLHPGGMLLIETWDRASAIARFGGSHWQQLSPPSVVHLFSRDSLARALERTGFAPASMRVTSKRVSMRFVSTLLAHKYPRIESQLLAVAGSRLGSWSIPYRLGDLMTAVATARPA